jgi:hypothetical protein
MILLLVYTKVGNLPQHGPNYIPVIDSISSI